jgi:ADP-ribose pyrophosphatase YjhB (NUDIX family)
MYKVFIDHKPIVCVKKQDLSTNSSHINLSDINSFPEDILPHFDEVDIDHPLQLICTDVEHDFEKLFADYRLIEASGGIVISEFGYLVIERNGLWDIPKGKMERGENPKETAVREIEEECGIKNPIVTDFITETYHTYIHKGENVLKKTYWYKMAYSGESHLTPQKEEGITQVKWMTESEMFSIRKMTYGSINEVLDVFQEKFLVN